jgi:Xaa-Pro aminopeptidase
MHAIRLAATPRAFDNACMDYPAQRRDRLMEALAAQGPDALLISNPVNVTYLTAFSGDTTALVLSRDRAVLVSDSRYTEQIAEECPGLDAVIRPPVKPLPTATAETIDKLGFRSVGFDSAHLTVAEFGTLREQAKSVDWKPESNRVEAMRAVKDVSEVAAIREAIDIAERAYTVFCALLRPHDCEKDLHDAMEGYIRRAGGTCSSFPPIIAAGERAALPHAPPTGKRIADSAMLLVDWGATGWLYKSDLTRVLALNTISPKLEEVYGVVLRAQTTAIRAARPGVHAKDVDAEARAVIAQAGFGDFFGHGLGHGIGLDIHEAPALRPNSEAVLEPGNVVTIEPGIYLPGWGGVRIEDDILVTPDGCEVLTRVPKELASIRAF